jgi:hypothetical protein
MQFRDYNPEKDKAAVHRIWLETGWIEKGHEDWMDTHLSSGPCLVADVEGEAECLVHRTLGSIRHLHDDLRLCVITAVTTSRIARKQGLAGRLTAKAIAMGAREGGLVSALGMFEQGYYNRHGFGTGVYENYMTFHPALLDVYVKARVPVRISANDWAHVHQARLGRRRGHGSCTVDSPNFTRADMESSKTGFGLGYRDLDGKLGHHIWCSIEGSVERGPYRIHWLVFRNRDEFLELMALLKGMGDQVFKASMREVPGVQIQDLLRQPFMMRTITDGGKFTLTQAATAWWQMRINDLPGALAKTHIDCGDVRFNLRLTDPIEQFLLEDSPWRGCAGNYVVALGKESSAKSGEDSKLPTMDASVNAFTRMWLGVRSASGLSYTDDLQAPPKLLEQLDRALQMPLPKPDWDF